MPRRFFLRTCALLSLALSTACVDECSAPSSSVDAGDLLGVFDRDAGPRSDGGIIAIRPKTSASAPQASASGSAAPPASAFVRAPGAQTGCVETRSASGAPPGVVRTLGRPACRGGRVSEWRDANDAPRYLCVHGPTGDAARSLPLVLYFHGDTPGLDDPAALTKQTSLRGKTTTFSFDGGDGKKGFLLAVVQGRALANGERGATYDIDAAPEENVDIQTADHFLGELVRGGQVDPGRVYALGIGRGADMAATYAMWRADRIAAFGGFAPVGARASWTCPAPPPPAFLIYRACDAVASCADVEAFLLARGQQRAETEALRLGEDNKTEPSCAVKNACSEKKGQMHHNRWPKGREEELLKFFAMHRLAKGQ